MAIVLLAGDGESTWIVLEALRRRFPVSGVIVEESAPALRTLRRRARKVGWWTVVGQATFVLYARSTRRFSRDRREEISREHGLVAARPASGVTHVASANDTAAIELLRALDPTVVVVNGTRILSPQVLSCVAAPFLNMHAGLTPLYRGVHGCYWALANDDAAHAGVTVHLVDSGVDTGDVVAQALVHPTEADSYHTYPLLQLAAGLPLLEQAVDDALKGRLRSAPAAGESRLYYHPTIWQYLATRLRRGVR